MLASVACKPDPAQENLEPEGPRVALDLPEGWTKSDGDSSQTTYANGETLILIVVKLPEAEIDMIKFITTTFATQGMKLAMAPLPAEGGRDLWSLTIDDTPAGRGFVARWSCPWGPVAGIYVDASGGDPAPGKALLLGARCN